MADISTGISFDEILRSTPVAVSGWFNPNADRSPYWCGKPGNGTESLTVKGIKYKVLYQAGWDDQFLGWVYIVETTAGQKMALLKNETFIAVFIEDGDTPEEMSEKFSEMVWNKFSKLEYEIKWDDEMFTEQIRPMTFVTDSTSAYNTCYSTAITSA